MNSPPVLGVVLEAKILLVVVSVSELEEAHHLFRMKPLKEVNQKRMPFFLVDPARKIEILFYMTAKQKTASAIKNYTPPF